ncbi:hypothetical protein Ae201684P_019903 [Aphanomyces euteiches]|uniref:DDE Tnp4 domain-containing protein n=1 Tax=Aphanomyces euteiches TaxID=100861 RepID=A0A6G0WIV0_9STRA|nr:hypothetical protein Ae201684_014771 [Aphanomyces euteiches]KAH9078833.1 hypothetical protein Ae201684P_019903 [Aphanomyces euteiches]
MPRHTFDLLVRECRPWIPKRMPVRDVIGVAVHWLATGASTRVQEALFMNQNFTQIAKYRKAGVLAILKAMKKNGIYGNEPHEHDRMTNTTAAFGLEHPMFGRCLGALDGTHVPIIVPQTMESRFRNRKADITTNVLGVVDEMARFISVFAGAEGCASDGYVYNHVNWEANVPDGYFYLGDAGYRLSKKLLTPYRSTRYHLQEWANSEDDRPQNARELFNYLHSKARIIVERAFGMLKRKWQVFASPVEVNVNYAVTVIHAACALHNFCINLSPIYMEDFSTSDLAAFQNELSELHEDNVEDPGLSTDLWRDNIANDMWTAYNGYRNRVI